MRSDLSKMTFGAELEVSDCDRRVPIPPALGDWAMTETDVINRHDERRGLACDPLGIEPHWGGEVNLRPSRSVAEASDRMATVIHQLVKLPQNIPDFDAFNAAHVHVRIPGLKDDLEGLKRLMAYVRDNQDDILEYSFQNYKPPQWAKSRTKVHTIPLDGKRKMQSWMIDNIIEHATTPEEVFKIQLKGKDAKTPYRIFRYSVNVYNLTMMDTVELRWFRPTVDPHRWSVLFAFTERFFREALEGGTPARDWMGDYKLPPERDIDLELWDAWEKTRYTQERFLKDVPRRRLQEV